ncbi:MAG: hypothetical protein LAO51_15020 [Acidobacteriia bacterium]|nr:hypothetical protein [Terriglobia bacterium]
MNRRSLAVVALLVLSVLVTSLPALAQSSGATITSNVPFEFNVAGKSFPAGEYRVLNQPRQVPALRLQSVDGKLNAALSPITRLARQSSGEAPKGSLVFDMVDGKHFLSEVWMPGQDGYLVHVSKTEEQHVVVDVKQ